MLPFYETFQKCFRFYKTYRKCFVPGYRRWQYILGVSPAYLRIWESYAAISCIRSWRFGYNRGLGGDKLTEAGILCIPHPKLCGVSHINILGNILFSHIAGKPTLIRENVWCNCFNWQIENSRKIQGPKLIHLWTLFQDFLRGFVCVTTVPLRIKDWMDLMWFLPTGGINRVSQIF